jgi:FixJ family two-component response regulator
LANDDLIIAIVDDDTLVRESLQRLVNSLNFKAEQFSSPDALLAYENLHEVRCVICDVNISGGTTERFLQRLTSIGHHIPFVFMTALPSAALRARLMDAGAVCVLTKPFHQREIEMCLSAALEQSTRPQRLAMRQQRGRNNPQSSR